MTGPCHIPGTEIPERPAAEFRADLGQGPNVTNLSGNIPPLEQEGSFWLGRGQGVCPVVLPVLRAAPGWIPTSGILQSPQTTAGLAFLRGILEL